ncbi:MAG: substrate-binding domain-containing protein [Solirubrobacterales bacterium]
MKALGQSRGRWLFALLAIGLVAMFVAACGGGSDTTSGGGGEEATSTEGGGEETGGLTPSSTAENASYLYQDTPLGGGIRPGSGELTEKSIEAGEEAGAEAGEAQLPNAKIGVINFLNGIESSDRLADSATFAAAELGWETIVCDGKGTPSQFVACGNSLIAQGVDGILAIAIEPGQIQSVVKKANSQGIPIAQIGGGGVPLGDYNGNFGPNEAKAGELLTEGIFEKLEPLDGNPEVIVHNFPARWGAERTEQFEKAVEEQDKIKIADNVVTDAADLVQFTRSTVTTEITQYPDAAAYWFTFDTTGQVGGGVIASKYPGKEFPDKPLVTTFHGDLATLGLIAKGDIDLISDVNYDASSWMGVDGIAQELAHEEPMSTENQPQYPVIGDAFTYINIDRENLPEEGEYMPTEWDVPAYFISKWKAEYGL